MSRFVATAFKAVAYSIIMIIVFNVTFYLLKAYSLNQKMETLLTSMSQEVSRNNYLSEGSYDMYVEMLRNIRNDMNNGENFIVGYRLNYGHDSQYNPAALGVGGINYQRDLAVPGAYNDIAIIELTVGIRSLNIFYDAGAATELDRLNVETGDDGALVRFTYTAQVPCLRYISVES